MTRLREHVPSAASDIEWSWRLWNTVGAGQRPLQTERFTQRGVHVGWMRFESGWGWVQGPDSWMRTREERVALLHDLQSALVRAMERPNVDELTQRMHDLLHVDEPDLANCVLCQAESRERERIARGIALPSLQAVP